MEKCRVEFVELGRYIPLKAGPRIAPFEELRRMEPLWLTQNLKLVEEDANLAYGRRLASEGLAVVPIRRRPPFAKFTDRVDFPRRVILEMTSRCNYLCRMCPQQNLKRPRMDMPGTVYRGVIDELDLHGIEGIWLYHLGESLLHPEFRENIAHISAKRNLGIIWMSTNGRYFTEDIVRSVLASNIDYINYSAHAVTEATYDTVAPPGNFKYVQENLERFYAIKGTEGLPRRPFLHCQMIEQETTRHEVDAFIAAHYQRAEIVSINMLEYVNLPNNAFGMRQRERKPLTTCSRVARNDCFICSNGHVTICDAAYNGEIYLGDINTQSLHEIWNGERRREILRLNAGGRMSEMEFCRSCTDYDI